MGYLSISRVRTPKMVIDNVRLLTDFFFYFAFGSNLLTERIRVQIKGAQLEECGVLKNYTLKFFDYGSRWKGAVASIEEQEDQEVHGCVWRVPNSFAAELDLQESGYHRLIVPVKLYSSNETITCRTYQYSNPTRELKAPSPHYKHVIVEGAKEHELPDWYVQKLEAIEDNGYVGKVLLDLKAIEHLNQ
ncbi:Gamma-glutamylcyclotransferase [Aphelenchoides besseyi]|nr:Gamma-glutamylcyclotransferase [Aphelenchoides besseyi]